MSVNPASIEDYVCDVSRPDDFGMFWSEIMCLAADIPLNIEMILDPLRSSDGIDTYQVFYDSLDGVRVSSWYCVPKGKKGKLPALVFLPGYQMDPPIPKEWARRGFATLAVAPRGKLRSMGQFNPGYPNLLTTNITDKNTYSYRGFYVDTWRTIDVLLAQDEVDCKNIGVLGSSQGGGLAITTAAMRKEIKAASSGAPYLCGFMDAIKLEDTYPYEEINDYLRVHPEHYDLVRDTLSYFDGINFAEEIACPIIMNIGLQDNVCPPETGYAVFNSIGSKDKELFVYEGHGHEAGRYLQTKVICEFFDKHLKNDEIDV